MIPLTNIESPSLHIQERAKSMWATKYDQGVHTLTYKVVPFGRKFEHKTKDRRLVLFDLRRRTVDCLSLETGEVCEANFLGRLCSHAYCAYKKLDAANRRREAGRGSDLRVA